MSKSGRLAPQVANFIHITAAGGRGLRQGTAPSEKTRTNVADGCRLSTNLAVPQSIRESGFAFRLIRRRTHRTSRRGNSSNVAVGMPNTANEECRAVQVARAFFQASTKLSDDNEDILPQEDGVDQKLSVFHLFSELFPEYANDKDRDGGNTGKSGLMRLQFNKIGYEMYDKEQSRRVPAVRAKPGNPGYGFRRARWRDTMGNGEDRRACETVLRTLGVSQERLDRIRQRISDFREEWNNVRRPSRPAGPGRPRGHKRANPSDPMESIDPLPELTGVLPMLSQ
eukprot:CAMPEP_0173060614 /NCGR_PEP_ID=MMETSP1102-20130122/2709_1 /TAXON_ID=49646 /ORGANISM="Geminigera sp., Strain Caron Lab Isolate" /LENGTH=282 /DNA_ID=CAMNT_0013926891 /DNA_START=101 /DNA_END=947 /DNA_ORIENTATION=-